MRLVILPLLLLPLGLAAQWASVGGGILTGNVNMVYYDSLEQRLYMVGDQRYMLTDNVQVNGVCYWDGTAWSALGTGVDDPGIGLVSPVRAMCKYDSALFVAGSFFGMGSVPNTRRVAKWKDGAWHSCGLDSLAQPYGSALRLTVIDDTLHMLGPSAIVYQGDTIKAWAKYDGEHWFAGDASEDWSYAPTTVVKYQGQLYVGGNFDLSGGQNDLVRRTASGWEVLGQGLLGDPWVNDMIEYDGLLWVAGEFYQAAGNAASCVMAWDGSQWLEPFPELDFFAQCRDLAVIDGKLYFGGAMYVDGLNGYYGLGSYDGEQVCILGGPEVLVGSLAGSADTLYLGGCKYVDCSQSGVLINKVGKWPLDAPPDICFDAVVGMDEADGATMAQLRVVPNPAGNGATLFIHLDVREVRVHNGQGQEVLRANPGYGALYLPTGTWAEGCYHVSATDGKGSILGRAKVLVVR